MCLLLCFDSVYEDDEDSNSRRIVFERVQFVPLDLKRHFAGPSRPVEDGSVIHDGAMERRPRNCAGFVNFANFNFEYGKVIASYGARRFVQYAG